MIEQIEDMPDGTVGFRAVGTVEPDDYKNVLDPAIETQAAAGGVRMLYEVGDDFDRYSLGALWQDSKLGLTHSPRIWKRIAFVSNHDFLSHAVAIFAPIMPGEVKIFPLEQLEAAKQWTAAD